VNSSAAYSLLLQIDAAQPGQVPGFLDTWTVFVMVLKMCLTLGAVCILAFIVLRYGLPRITGMPKPQDRLMKVVSRYPLDAQKSLYLVEIAGKHMLLGVTEQRIEMLSELDSEAVQEAIDSEMKEPESQSMARLGSSAVKEFSKYLRR
jgi:flagellar biosynthetic protein FliO